MTPTTRLLRRSDPARHLEQALDQRAETELAALIGSAPAAAPRGSHLGRARPQRRLRTTLVTGGVAAVVVALSIAVLGYSPVTRGDLPQRPAAAGRPSASPSTGADASGALIGPRGSKVLTRAELHAFVQRTFDDAGSTNAILWEEQQWLAIRCMAESGWLWDPTLDRAPHPTPATDGLSASEEKSWQDALGGAGSTSPYNWRTDADWSHAGCIGRAVHATGQDRSE